MAAAVVEREQLQSLQVQPPLQKRLASADEAPSIERDEEFVGVVVGGEGRFFSTTVFGETDVVFGGFTKRAF